MPRAATTLTLLLEGTRITAEQFTRAVDDFFTLIREVSQEVTGQRRALDLVVSVKEGSIHLSATAEPKSPSVDAEKITGSVFAGVKALGGRKVAKTKKRPPFFSDTALEKARDLASLVESAGISGAQVRMQRKRIVVKRTTMQNVDLILGAQPSEIGCIEGVIEMMSISGGKPRFAIREPIAGRQVACQVTRGSDLYHQALAAFGQRVAVFGRVRYRESGEPSSIDVREIRPFPPTENLPTAEDVYGILSR